MNIEIIFAEFGRVNVDVDHFRHYFPEAKFTLITDVKENNHGFDYVKRPHPTFSKEDPRYGWHMNDYWQIQAMFFTDADICIAFDSDIRIVSDKVKNIIPLVKKFGLCLAANPRLTVGKDATIGIDGGKVKDDSGGVGFAYNTAVTALYKGNMRAMDCASEFLIQMKTEPVRAPLAWWRAVWETEFNPYLLPFQWTVCADHVGIGDEIILHTGHEKVKEYYKL